MTSGWPATLELTGFVLRSLDITGNSLIEIERIAGFRFGAFRQGIALYRLKPQLLKWFVADPVSHLSSLGLYQVGFNDERGKRDWEAMEIFSLYGITHNGYNAETVRSNASLYSPSATPYGPSDVRRINELAMEMTMLLANGGFIGKLVFPHRAQVGLADPKSPPATSIPNYEAYPAGGGIREYQLLRPQPFELVSAYSGRDLRDGKPLAW